MSSASSTARWMDCTVDSMLTTTPFFSPREGWEPTPITSILPSAVTSPTSATTFEVPISNPTIRLRSVRLDIASIAPVLCITGAGAAPADGKAIRVTHVDVGNVRSALRYDPDRRRHEGIESFVKLLTAEAHGHAVVQVQFPGAAGIQAQRRDAHAHFLQPVAHREVALNDTDLRAIGAGQPRQLQRNMRGVMSEQIAARVEQT